MPKNPWSDGDRPILETLADGQPRYAAQLAAELGMDIKVVRTLLAENVHAGHLTATRGAVHTTYRVTAKGEAYLRSMLAGVA
jgi:predicted transcriptional regulator